MPPERSSRKKVPKGANQAVCAEPGMVQLLEEAIIAWMSSCDPRWIGLLIQWIMCIGNIRLRHIQRSYPVRQTGTTLYAFCCRGKQKRFRAGFEWSVPTHLVSRPDVEWATPFLKEWKKARDPRKGDLGFAFDIELKKPYANSACIAQVQSALCGRVQNLECVPTNTWRRILPTLAALDSHRKRSWLSEIGRTKPSEDATLTVRPCLFGTQLSRWKCPKGSSTSAPYCFPV